MGERCFLKVTNADVYQKLLDIESKVNNQNSRIKINTWLGTTSLTLVVGAIVGIIL